MPTLQVPSRLENLAEVNAFIESHVPEDFRDQLPNILLVCEELLVNVFSYAYEDGMTGQARVDLMRVHFDGEDMLSFSTQDWGKPFNPFASVEDPDLTLGIEERPIGGLGVFLIRQLTVHQLYAYENGSNWIHVFFKRGGPDCLQSPGE